ncbi:Photosystem II reaction center PSB28 protein [Spatholobus suberectus]|nr:Photosystem II reaction center PSB28 protein [Spatholobus suberectus]
MAMFTFDQPSVLDSSGEIGDMPGLYMIHEGGVLQSVDVSAKFVNGKPSQIETEYVMRTPREWDRFMDRYSNLFTYHLATNFDSTYCNALGYVAAALFQSEKSGLRLIG